MKRLGIFQSVLLSYILITLLPISVLLGITLNHVNQSYERGILDSRLDTLRSMQAMLELRLRECKSIASQFNRNIHVSRFTLAGSAYDAYLARNELSRINSANEFLLDIGLYYFGTDALYSTQGMTELRLGLSKYYGLSRTDIETLLETIHAAQDPTLISLREYTRLIYAIPLPLNSISSNGVVLFLFDSSALDALFRDYENDPRDLRFAFRSDGALLYASDAGMIPALTDIPFPLSKGQTVEYAGVHYRTLSVQSEDDNPLISFALIKSTGLTPLFNGYATLLISTLAVTVLCLTLGTYFAVRFWAPIHALNLLVSNQHEGAVYWEPLQNAVREAISKNDRLEGALGEQTRVLQENFLLRLIHGQCPINPQAEMRSLNLDATKNKACVLSVLLDNAHRIGVIEGLLKQQRACTCCAAEMGDEISMVIAIFIGDDGEIPDSVRVFARTLSQALLSAGAEDCFVGVGRAMPLNELKWSYLQAMAARKVGVTQAAHMTFVNEIPNSARMLPGLYEKEMLLALAMRQGNAPLAAQLAEELIDYAARSAPSLFRYTCYCLLNRVMAACSEQPELAGGLDLEAVWPTLAQRIDNGVPLDFRREMIMVIRRICDGAADASSLREASLAGKVLEFVSENAMKNDFSLDMLTDAYGLSSGYWSRFFREKLNHSFSDYVWKLRLAKAKELLEQTDLPVKEVVERIGYIDTRSFIRKFKSCEGVTPGQYKILHDRKIRGE